MWPLEAKKKTMNVAEGATEKNWGIFSLPIYDQPPWKSNLSLWARILTPVHKQRVAYEWEGGALSERWCNINYLGLLGIFCF